MYLVTKNYSNLLADEGVLCSLIRLFLRLLIFPASSARRYALSSFISYACSFATFINLSRHATPQSMMCAGRHTVTKVQEWSIASNQCKVSTKELSLRSLGKPLII